MKVHISDWTTEGLPDVGHGAGIVGGASVWQMMAMKIGTASPVAVGLTSSLDNANVGAVQAGA